MLNKLRLKFTLICSISTSILLACLLVCTYLLMVSQLKNRTLLTLTNELNTLKNYLETSTLISQSWLSELEFNNDLIIHIEENKTPLLFKGNYVALNKREQLISDAKKLFPPEASLTSPTSSPNHIFFFQDSSPYLASFLSFQYQNNYYSLLLIKDMSYFDQQKMHLLYILILLGSICIILLTLFSYWFACRVIAPIAISDQKQKNFIAAVSHELRSPLAVLKSSASALNTKIPPENSRFLTAIDNECDRLSHLVDDLLLLTNADAHNHWELSLTAVEADTLLLDLYDLFYAQCLAQSHPITLLLPDEPVPPCLLDEERIKQILSIFIDNALSYTPTGCKIELTLEVKNTKLCFKVIDHGSGIPDAYKTQIFDRFYRVDTSRHSKAHYGLGLSIALELTKLHQGQLSIEDTEGGGCTFTLSLPKIFP